MRIRSHLIILAILFWASAGCRSSQVIVDRPTYQNAINKIKKGDKKAWQYIEDALAKEPPEKQKNLHTMILQDLGGRKYMNARTLLNKYAKNSDVKKRGVSIEALAKHLEYGSRADVEKELVSIIRANTSSTKSILNEEIAALAMITSSDSVSILKGFLGKNEEQDSLIIEAIGGQLVNEKQGQENEPEPDASEPEENSSPAGSDKTPEEKGTGEPEDEGQRAPEGYQREQVLLDYLKTEASFDLKKLTLNSLYNAYRPHGQTRLLNIIRDRRMPASTRILTIRYLVEKNLSGQERGLAPHLRNLYFDSPGEVALKENLVVQIAKLENKSPVKVLQELRRIIWQDEWRLELRRMKKKAYRNYIASLKRMSARKALFKVLRSRGVKSSTLNKMHVSLKETAAKEEWRIRAEGRFLYAALKKMYPKRNYYELNTLGEKSLHIRKLFTTIMKIVLQTYKADTLQVIAVQKVFRIERTEAQLVRDVYLRNKKFFKIVNL